MVSACGRITCCLSSGAVAEPVPGIDAMLHPIAWPLLVAARVMLFGMPTPPGVWGITMPWRPAAQDITLTTYGTIGHAPFEPSASKGACFPLPSFPFGRLRPSIPATTSTRLRKITLRQDRGSRTHASTPEYQGPDADMSRCRHKHIVHPRMG